MFKVIKGFTRSNVDQVHVNKRFEFFQHYWSTVDSKNNKIFFDEIRLESHRSIILKIENQLNYNFKDSYNWFMFFFTKHSFFENTNIIAKKKTIQDYRTSIINLIDPTGTTAVKQKKINYNANEQQIVSFIRKIKSIILGRENYSMQLAKHLIKILSKNTPIKEQDKFNLKFLINSYIVELYHYGYSLDYISKIPDILIYKDYMNDFPFEKTSADFLYDKKKYEEYVKKEKKSMKMDKLLGGLINLINRPWREGYFVFKIDNIFLHQPNPIEICGVTFYNPQITRMINLSEVKTADSKARYKNVEDFYSPSVKDKIDNSKLSNCNAIVKSNFKASKNIQSTDELFIAFHKVRQALDVLNNVINRYGSVHKGKGKISLHKNFQLHKNKKIASYNFNIFWDESKSIDINDSDELKYFIQELEYINKLDLTSKLRAGLFNIISTHNKIENDEVFFNFKDLWISWEALLKKNKLIELAQTCFYIRYKKIYLTKIKIFLENKIKEDSFHPKSEYYVLNKNEQNKIGLDVPILKRIPILKFKNNYQLLEQYIPIEIIKYMVQRIDEFLSNENLFFDKLNLWIKNTINEIYIERNMEVHSNLRNGLSQIKLKNDFVFISQIVVGFIIDNLDK